MFWAAFVELCEMGVVLDIDKIYNGMSLQVATDIMNQTTSQLSSTSSDWKPLHSKQTSKKSTNKFNSNNHNNNHNNRHNNNNIMERRKSAEQIRDSRASPHAATSLGNLYSKIIITIITIIKLIIF